MRTGLAFGAALVTCVAGIAPAHACRVARRLVPEDVKYADIVVVGRISNYERVSDKTWPYGRFRINVETVLAGKAPKTLTAIWELSTSEAPEGMTPGPYVIALRRPTSPIVSPEPDTPRVISMPCSPGFVVPVAQPEAARIGEILTGKAVAGLGVLAASWPARPGMWMFRPDSRKPDSYYPLRARMDKVEGWASIECIANTAGRVRRCVTVYESRRSYGFGQATARLFRNEAQLQPGTFTPDEPVRLTWRWQMP